MEKQTKKQPQQTFQSKVTLGEIHLEAYESPEVLCNYIVTLLKQPEVKAYLDYLRKEKNKSLPSYL